MNGVEILAVEQVAVAWEYNWGVFWGVSLVVFGLFLISGVVIAVDEADAFPVVLFAIIGVFLGAIIGEGVGGGTSLPAEYVNEYKVLISEDVSLVEFNERYEIIDQQGKIYTVRERNGESK